MISYQLPEDLSPRLADLYRRMEAAYDAVAARLAFSCEGCGNNCCDSYFLHHTHMEWGYLQEGLCALPPEKQEEIRSRAEAYAQEADIALGRGERPIVMCPLNESGRCILYSHRMMICRMHGVPSRMTRPDLREIDFPGCHRCQEQTKGTPQGDLPFVDRTPLYRELAELEKEFLSRLPALPPRVKLSLAQMILALPPAVS